MLTFLPGQTWCTLAGGNGGSGSGGPRLKKDGIRDRTMPQAVLIGLHVAEEGEPSGAPVPALLRWPQW